tara:strand:- start:597 stop:827 length:231 start_codon:yes stop_codon:yes gene_type:complete
MNIKESILKKVIERIDNTSRKIREIEDAANKFSVDCGSDRVYNSLVGYRQGLQDILHDLRSIDGKNSIGRNFQPKQ